MGDAFAGKQLGKRAMFYGAVAQSLPDIDFIAAAWTTTSENLLAHRGFTHSILIVVLITPLLALLAERWHRPHNISIGKWMRFFGVQAFIHLLIDGMNVYGVGWFEPFSHHRVSYNWIYVADANRPNSNLGLGAIAQQIATARGEARNCLLFDNGDFLQGNPLADYVAAARRRRVHPVITAFNTLGYDAVTIGNHEFDYGLRFLSDVLANAAFPVVSANVATRLGPSPARDETLLPPFTIQRRQIFDHEGRAHLLRIGVIGFAPPQVAEWDRDSSGGKVHTRDILAAARAWLPRLRAQGP